MGTRKVKRNSAEASLQRAVVQHLLLRGVPGLIYMAVPNGMVSDPISVLNMKAQGLLPGAPDLVVFVPPRNSDEWPYPLCLELKAEKGRLSEAQRDFRESAERIDLAYAVAHSLDEAISVLTEFGALKTDANEARRAA